MANPGAILKHFAAMEAAEMRYAEAVEPLKPGLPLRSRFGDGDKWIDEYADGWLQPRFESDNTMSSKAIIKTGSGEVLTLDVAKPVTLTAGQAVTIAVTPASAVGVVQFYDFSGPKLVNLGYANKVPYELQWTVPQDRETRTLGVALALHNKPIEPTLHYPIIVRPAGTAANPGGGNVPAGIPKPSAPGKWPALGACFDMWSGMNGWCERADALGVTHLRSFSTSCPIGGKYSAGNQTPVDHMMEAFPWLTLVGMHGVPESNPLPPDDGDWESFWTQHKARVAHYGDRYWTELFNEPESDHYLQMGFQAPSTVDPKVVSYVVNVAKICRDVMGPEHHIVGPSIGYLDNNAAAHIAWTNAFVDAGILNYITHWNDHIYFKDLDQLQQLIAGVRAIIGDKSWVSTEFNLRGLPLAQWPAKAPAMLKAVQDAGILPFHYRLMPAGGSGGDMYGMALHDADGNVNTTVASAYGLTAPAK